MDRLALVVFLVAGGAAGFPAELVRFAALVFVVFLDFVVGVALDVLVLLEDVAFLGVVTGFGDCQGIVRLITSSPAFISCMDFPLAVRVCSGAASSRMDLGANRFRKSTARSVPFPMVIPTIFSF